MSIGLAQTTMWIASILSVFMFSFSLLTNVVGILFCILFIHRMVFRSLTLIFHFSSICFNFTALSSIALEIFHNKNSALGSNCFAILSSAFFKAFSAAFALSSLLSLAHHLVLSLCLEFMTTFFDTPFATKNSQTVSMSHSIYSFFNHSRLCLF